MNETLAALDRDLPLFFATFAFLLGLCVGSFLNVCILRIPRGRSVVFPGSHCVCGKPIAWHDNLPVLSWLLLRGKARCCGSPFSFRYPAVELLTGLLFLACWTSREPAVALCGMVLVSLLVAASFIDWDHLFIPDRFSIGGMITGVVLSVLVPALHGAGTGEPWLVEAVRGGVLAVTGAFVASALVLWIGLLSEVLLRRETMGFGDVKLLGAIGAFCGWQGGVFALFAGAVVGVLLYPLGKVLGRTDPIASLSASPTLKRYLRRERGDPVEEADAAREIPFGPSLAIAGLVYFLWLHPVIDLYFAEITLALFPR